MPFENDSVITWELMVETELGSANISATRQRTVSMTNQYFGGVAAGRQEVKEPDLEIQYMVWKTVRKYEDG